MSGIEIDFKIETNGQEISKLKFLNKLVFKN